MVDTLLHFGVIALLLLGAGAALLTLPGTIELSFLTLGGLLPRRKRDARDADNTLMKLAVVVPAHNEQDGIGDCVRSILNADWTTVTGDVVVVADNCSDATAEKAEAAGARVLIRHDEKLRGKGYALDFVFNTLLPEGYQGFLVVDADSSVSSNLMEEVGRAFRAGADAVQCRYIVNPPDDRKTAGVNTLAVNAFNFRSECRGRLGLSAGILGNGFGLTAETLKAVPYDATSVVEDLEYHLRLVRSGRKVLFLSAASVDALMPASVETATGQRARWEGGRFRMIREHVPRLAGAVLRGRIALLEPMFELTLLPISYHVALLLLSLVAPSIWVRGYAVLAILIIFGFLVLSVLRQGQKATDLLTLFAAPFHLIWKLRMLPAVFRSARPGAAWIRTKREKDK